MIYASTAVSTAIDEMFPAQFLRNVQRLTATVRAAQAYWRAFDQPATRALVALAGALDTLARPYGTAIALGERELEAMQVEAWHRGYATIKEMGAYVPPVGTKGAIGLLNIDRIGPGADPLISLYFRLISLIWRVKLRNIVSRRISRLQRSPTNSSARAAEHS